MRTVAFILFSIAVAASGVVAHGHGIPIVVNVVDGRLTVSNGLADSEGYAPWIFANGSKDAALTPVNSPVLGEVLLADIPGFEIHDVEVDSGLYMEAIAPTVKDSNPTAQRLLWHWSPATESVEPVPQDMTLRVLSARLFGTLTLPQEAEPLPPLMVAEPRATDLGQHRHLLTYALDNSPPAAAGAYGFFARLTSPEYQPSEPLLVVLNYFLSESQLEQAALAINTAASDPDGDFPLGDYNRDGAVDADDYGEWKTHFGRAIVPFALADGNGDGRIDAADYTVWRDNLSAEGVALTAAVANVPEPAGGGLLAVGALACTMWVATMRRGERREYVLWRGIPSVEWKSTRPAGSRRSTTARGTTSVARIAAPSS